MALVWFTLIGARDALCDRAFIAEPAQCLLQLLRLERVARARDREELRREIRNALEVQRFALGQRIADLQLAVIVDADDVAGDRVRTRHAFVGHERQRVADLHLASGAYVAHLDAWRITARTNAKKPDPVAMP